MAQAVYWHPRDPRQGIIAAGFAEACRYCGANKQDALARAAQEWHTEVGALPPDQRTPEAVQAVAEDTAAKHGVLQVFQVGIQRTILVLTPTGPEKPPELATMMPIGAPAGTLPGLGNPPPSRRDVRREQRDERHELNLSRRGFRKSERPTTTPVAGLEDGIGDVPPTTDPARDEWLVERLYRTYVESQGKYQDTQLERDRIELERSKLRYEAGVKALETGASVPKAISHDVTDIPKSLGKQAADAAKKVAEEAGDAAESGAGAVVVGLLVGGAVVFGLGYYAMTTGTATEAVKAGVAHGRETGKTVRSLGKTAAKVAGGR